MLERILIPVFKGETAEAAKEAGRVRHLLLKAPDMRITLQNYEEKMAKAIKLILSIDEIKQVTFVWDIEKQTELDTNPYGVPFGSWTSLDLG